MLKKKKNAVVLIKFESLSELKSKYQRIQMDIRKLERDMLLNNKEEHQKAELEDKILLEEVVGKDLRGETLTPEEQKILDAADPTLLQLLVKHLLGLAQDVLKTLKLKSKR